MVNVSLHSTVSPLPNLVFLQFYYTARQLGLVHSWVWAGTLGGLGRYTRGSGPVHLGVWAGTAIFRTCRISGPGRATRVVRTLVQNIGGIKTGSLAPGLSPALMEMLSFSSLALYTNILESADWRWGGWRAGGLEERFLHQTYEFDSIGLHCCLLEPQRVDRIFRTYFKTLRDHD